jgi:uncharacterized protein DUF4350
VRFDGRALWIGALLLAMVVAIVLRGQSTGDSPEHRTDSDAANGASALPQLAQALGHATTTLDGDFRPDLGMGVLFVLSPTAGFTKAEAQRLSDYAAGGGAVVYAAEQGDPQLDLTLRVSRGRIPTAGDARGSGPMLSGVGHVSGAVTAAPLVAAPDQVVVLRSPSGQPLGVERFTGRGRLVVLSDPLPLCNGYLQRADNGRLAADLVSLAPTGTSVAFDEYHHAVQGGGSPLTALLSTSWGVGITWAAVVLFAGLLLRGRAFGPRLRPPAPGHRSTLEYVGAVGDLLLRTRAAPATVPLLAAAARRALAARHGLAPGPGFEAALRARAPAEAAELAAAETALAAGGGDAALLAAVRRLHRLAYPEQPS